MCPSSEANMGQPHQRWMSLWATSQAQAANKLWCIVLLTEACMSEPGRHGTEIMYCANTCSQKPVWVNRGDMGHRLLEAHKCQISMQIWHLMMIKRKKAKFFQFQAMHNVWLTDPCITNVSRCIFLHITFGQSILNRSGYQMPTSTHLATRCQLLLSNFPLSIYSSYSLIPYYLTTLFGFSI